MDFLNSPQIKLYAVVAGLCIATAYAAFVPRQLGYGLITLVLALLLGLAGSWATVNARRGRGKYPELDRTVAVFLMACGVTYLAIVITGLAR